MIGNQNLVKSNDKLRMNILFKLCDVLCTSGLSLYANGISRICQHLQLCKIDINETSIDDNFLLNYPNIMHQLKRMKRTEILTFHLPAQIEEANMNKPPLSSINPEIYYYDEIFQEDNDTFRQVDNSSKKNVNNYKNYVNNGTINQKQDQKQSEVKQSLLDKRKITSISILKPKDLNILPLKNPIEDSHLESSKQQIGHTNINSIAFELISNQIQNENYRYPSLQQSERWKINSSEKRSLQLTETNYNNQQILQLNDRIQLAETPQFHILSSKADMMIRKEYENISFSKNLFNNKSNTKMSINTIQQEISHQQLNNLHLKHNDQIQSQHIQLDDNKNFVQNQGIYEFNQNQILNQTRPSEEDTLNYNLQIVPQYSSRTKQSLSNNKQNNLSESFFIREISNNENEMKNEDSLSEYDKQTELKGDERIIQQSIHTQMSIKKHGQQDEFIQLDYTKQKNNQFPPRVAECETIGKKNKGQIAPDVKVNPFLVEQIQYEPQINQQQVVAEIVMDRNQIEIPFIQSQNLHIQNVVAQKNYQSNRIKQFKKIMKKFDNQKKVEQKKELPLAYELFEFPQKNIKNKDEDENNFRVYLKKLKIQYIFKIYEQFSQCSQEQKIILTLAFIILVLRLI